MSAPSAIAYRISFRFPAIRPASIVRCAKPMRLSTVAAGSFRQDIYYWISAFPIHLPSLRERREDWPLLINTLLQRLAGVAAPWRENSARRGQADLERLAQVASAFQGSRSELAQALGLSERTLYRRLRAWHE